MSTEENEAADEAAKQGAEDGNMEIIKTPLIGAVTKTEIDNAIRQEWAQWAQRLIDLKIPGLVRSLKLTSQTMLSSVSTWIGMFKCCLSVAANS